MKKEVILVDLRAHGLLSDRVTAEQKRISQELYDYFRNSSLPKSWSFKDEDYSQKVLFLYSKLRELELDTKGEAPLIFLTRAMHDMYGCCPVVDDSLCFFLHIPSDTQELSLEIIDSIKAMGLLLALYCSFEMQPSSANAQMKQYVDCLHQFAECAYEEYQKRNKEKDIDGQF